MTRYDRKSRLMAAALSALAGYVDAIGYLASGGFFVSFMSGNSTRLGVGLAENITMALIALGLIAAFVSGVTIGFLLGARAGARRQTAILALVTLALLVAALLAPALSLRGALLALAFAMGAENALFEQDGEVRVGLTYMTGTLVKIGQRLSAALSGGNRWDWLPFALLWCAMIAGGASGAMVFLRLGLAGLWLAVLVAAVLTLLLRRHPIAPLAANASPTPPVT